MMLRRGQQIFISSVAYCWRDGVKLQYENSPLSCHIADAWYQLLHLQNCSKCIHLILFITGDVTSLFEVESSNCWCFRHQGDFCDVDCKRKMVHFPFSVHVSRGLMMVWKSVLLAALVTGWLMWLMCLCFGLVHKVIPSSFDLWNDANTNLPHRAELQGFNLVVEVELKGKISPLAFFPALPAAHCGETNPLRFGHFMGQNRTFDDITLSFRKLALIQFMSNDRERIGRCLTK